MSWEYEDILYLPHPVSASRPRMSRIDRAAQFSPFAALTGYDAAIRETGRLTDRCIELDVDGIELLNEKLRKVEALQELQPEITVLYFVPDERKSGGAYVRLTGKVKKVDSYEKSIILTDGTSLCFERIYDIRGERI